MNRLGYPCMNRSLRERGSIRANRGMHEKTLEDRGLPYVSELVIQNLKDLQKILVWNRSHDIRFYRCSSNLYPWGTEYHVNDLPRLDEIRRLSRKIGLFLDEHNMRMTFHPGQWCALASPTEETFDRARRGLRAHTQWLQLMDRPRDPLINIHVGGVYGEKEKTMNRLLDRLDDLDDRVTDRLMFENDDKTTMWSISDLVDGMGSDYAITYDHHHHQFSGDLRPRDAYERARETWDRRQIIHLSEPACLRPDCDQRPQAHSDFILDPIPSWIEDTDVMFEVKQKERAIQRYRRQIE